MGCRVSLPVAAGFFFIFLFFFSNFPPARGFFCRLLWAGLGLRAGPAVGLGAGWRTGLAAWVGGGIALVGE